MGRNSQLRNEESKTKELPNEFLLKNEQILKDIKTALNFNASYIVDPTEGECTCQSLITDHSAFWSYILSEILNFWYINN